MKLGTQVDVFANTVLATRTYTSIVIQMCVRHYTLVFVTSLSHLKRFTWIIKCYVTHYNTILTVRAHWWLKQNYLSILRLIKLILEVLNLSAARIKCPLIKSKNVWKFAKIFIPTIGASKKLSFLSVHAILSGPCGRPHGYGYVMIL